MSDEQSLETVSLKMQDSSCPFIFKDSGLRYVSSPGAIAPRSHSKVSTLSVKFPENEYLKGTHGHA
jgi:hypothetical protein